MKRIANYRSGDRAELLGVVLMQCFCAVAVVPRQEDFGIVDAVATLLRRDGQFLHAEDSFLVQFKSRTETSIEYSGARLKTLLEQELSLFIAHVDLTSAEIKLYSVAQAISHPNVRDVKDVVVYFGSTKQQMAEDQLHVSLGEPILTWSAAQLADQEFENNAYQIMKQWLVLDRSNRRYRSLGIQNRFSWETNEIPFSKGTWMQWDPRFSNEIFEATIPAIQVLASRALTDHSIAVPIVGLINWLRANGADPDPNGVLTTMIALRLNAEKITTALNTFPEADAAVGFVPIAAQSDRGDFWLQVINRSGSGSSKRFSGSWEELADLGFEVDRRTAPDAQDSIVVSAQWIEKQGFHCVEESNGVTLLRRIALNLESPAS